MSKLKWVVRAFLAEGVIPEWLDTLEDVVIVSMVSIPRPPNETYIVVLAGCAVDDAPNENSRSVPNVVAAVPWNI